MAGWVRGAIVEIRERSASAGILARNIATVCFRDFVRGFDPPRLLSFGPCIIAFFLTLFCLSVAFLSPPSFSPLDLPHSVATSALSPFVGFEVYRRSEMAPHPPARPHPRSPSRNFILVLLPIGLMCGAGELFSRFFVAYWREVARYWRLSASEGRIGDFL